VRPECLYLRDTRKADDRIIAFVDEPLAGSYLENG